MRCISGGRHRYQVSENHLICHLITAFVICVFTLRYDISYIFRSKFGRWQRGGNASNVCTVLAQLGTNCEYMGAFSTNKMFKFVIDDLVERGIRISNCSYHDNCEAPISSIILSGGQRTIVFSNPNLPHFQFDDFRRINLNHYDWIHFEVMQSIHIRTTMTV